MDTIPRLIKLVYYSSRVKKIYLK